MTAAKKSNCELLLWWVFRTADGSMALPALPPYAVQLCETGFMVLSSIVLCAQELK